VREAFAGREDVAVVAVFPGPPSAVARLRDRAGLAGALLADPEWTVHAAYGFLAARLRDVWLSRDTIAAYARLLRRGRRLRRPREDTRRLGGDAIVDPDGNLAWIYRSRGSTDRPSAGELARSVDEAAATARGRGASNGT